jgi:hypothetical protein
MLDQNVNLVNPPAERLLLSEEKRKRQKAATGSGAGRISSTRNWAQAQDDFHEQQARQKEPMSPAEGVLDSFELKEGATRC